MAIASSSMCSQLCLTAKYFRIIALGTKNPGEYTDSLRIYSIQLLSRQKNYAERSLPKREKWRNSNAFEYNLKKFISSCICIWKRALLLVSWKW